MLLTCIPTYEKSVLRYKILILDTYHPDTLQLWEQDMRILGYFSNPKGVCEQNVWETLV
jgi:hypothetical protein